MMLCVDLHLCVFLFSLHSVGVPVVFFFADCWTKLPRSCRDEFDDTSSLVVFFQIGQSSCRVERTSALKPS